MQLTPRTALVPSLVVVVVAVVVLLVVVRVAPTLRTSPPSPDPMDVKLIIVQRRSWALGSTRRRGHPEFWSWGVGQVSSQTLNRISPLEISS
jgi:hypothetical protein